MTSITVEKRIKRFFLPALVLVLSAALSVAGSGALAKPKKSPTKNKKIQIGKASYYSNQFHGVKTASGRIYNRHHLVAAHPSYPYGTRVRVTNLGNTREVEVRIIDRGPSRSQRKKGIIIDVSRAAAEKLGMVKRGRARVKLKVLEWGKFRKIAEEDHEHESLS